MVYVRRRRATCALGVGTKNQNEGGGQAGEDGELHDGRVDKEVGVGDAACWAQLQGL